MLTIIDPLLVIIAVAVCVFGLVKRSRLWRMGQDGEADKTDGNRLMDLITDTIIHRSILKDPIPGLMHLAMFAACLVPLLVIIVMQVNFFTAGCFGGRFFGDTRYHRSDRTCRYYLCSFQTLCSET